MSVRFVTTHALARVLNKTPRTIARWCAAGEIDHTVRGTGRGKRYMIVVTNGKARVLGIEIAIP